MEGLGGAHHQGFHLDMESVKYGLISTFKTGNVVLDTLLCCLVPLIVSLVFSNLVHIKTWWDNTGYPLIKDLLFGRNKKPAKPEYTRVLINRRNQNCFYGGQQQDKTRQLMTAISLYIKTLQKSFIQADVSLVDVEETNPYNYYYGNQDHSKDQFANQEILWQPQNGLWIEVDDGVHFMRNDEVVDAGEKEGTTSKNMVTFSFKSNEDDGDKRIDAFLKKAYDWYKADINSRKDNTRYYYSYTAKDVANPDGNNVKYKRFALSEEKDFDAIFFPGKKELLTQLEHFKNKTGRYAIKGSAHKLGLLLYGPPGTGKTSFIKAIARHFGRHIISIPLARIETNEELLDLMFDLNIKVHGVDYPVKLTYRDCVFVLEDVDAASDVVQKRTNDVAPKTTTVKITKEVTIKSGGDTLGKSGGDLVGVGGSLAYNGSMSIPIQKDPSVESTTIVREVSRDRSTSGAGEAADLELNGLDDSDDEGLINKKDGRKKAGPSGKWFEHKDKLNLAGLLEVLDGVVDCPNRLVVMTSNHPEILDPALTRPGRIDKKLKLDYLAVPEAIEMTEHFLGPMTDKQKDQMTAVLAEQHKVVTPAILEQACAEHDQVDALIKGLHEIVKAAAPHHHK